jgi:hypothetical protein
METTNNTLFDETLKEHLADVAERAKGKGPEAAYARLFQRTNPHEIGYWLSDEMQRAEIRPLELINLVVNYMGAIMSITATCFASTAPLIIGLMVTGVSQYARLIMTGQTKHEGVVFDPKTGHAAPATMDGIMRGKNPLDRKEG